MTEPGGILDAERLREFLAGRLPEPEATRIEQLLSRDEIPEAVLRSLETGDTVREALRARPAGIEQADEEEEIVAELTERIRRLRAAPAGETPQCGLKEATVLFEAPQRYPFLRPAEEPEGLGRLGPYRVLSVLGEGGMGVVFRAEETRLDRAVALKVIKPELARDPEARQRFLREARAAAALNNDHVVPIYQVGEDGDVMYLAMPLLSGESLHDRLAGEGVLPTAEVLRIGREAAGALAAAHQRGLIHRDIKPANLWLESPGGRVKLLDFGLTRPSNSHLTDAGTVAGTPAYMAPEQVRGRPEPRSDLFSLGCVMYRMATGQPPFCGEDAPEVLANVAIHEPRPPREINGDIPAALSRLIEKLLAKEPHHRYQTAEQVMLQIEAIQRALAPVAGPAVGQSAAASGARRLCRGLVLLAAFAVVGFCVLAIRIRRPDGKVSELTVPAGDTVEVVAGPRAAAGKSAPAEWIVDDGDEGYTETGPGWKQGRFAGGFRGDYRFNDKGARAARWTVRPLPPGRYEVFVTWVPHLNRAFHVPITVFDGPTALGTVLIDQREPPHGEAAHGSGWKSLGVYSLGGGAMVVELDAAGAKYNRTKLIGGGVNVDAIRVVARPESARRAPKNTGTRKETPQ